MPLQHFIAHQITRNQPLEPAELKVRKDPLPINGITEELFRDLKRNAIKRSGKEYGRLSHAADHPLAAWLEELKDERMGFVSFSANIADLFKLAMDKNEIPIDGFLLLSKEHIENAELIHIHFVQHASGIYFDTNLDISDALILDIAGLRLSSTINLTDLASIDTHRRENAVTLNRWRGEKELSDAFAEAIGFSDKLDLSAETEVFLSVVDDYTKDLPDDVASQTKARVVEYCLEQDSVGKTVVIEELATNLQSQPEIKTDKPYSPPPKLSEFISEKKPELKPELIPDKAQIKNYVRISGRNELLSMSFASRCLGDSVLYDPESDSITIKNIPSSLKNRLKKHIAE